VPSRLYSSKVSILLVAYSRGLLRSSHSHCPFVHLIFCADAVTVLSIRMKLVTVALPTDRDLICAEPIALCQSE
jgi:hypothetical protein